MLYQLSTIELPLFQSSFGALNCRRCAPASECSLLKFKPLRMHIKNLVLMLVCAPVDLLFAVTMYEFMLLALYETV